MKGKVSDSNGPLVGASVVVKDNPAIGTMTDSDGMFTIKVSRGSTLLFSYLKKRRSYKVVEAAILHGQQLPPEFFDEGKPQRSFLQRGVTQIAVGVALTVAVGVVGDWDRALFGLGGVALGGGNVLAHFLGAKEQKTDGQ